MEFRDLLDKPNKPCILALPKKGRLSEKCLKLLEKIDVKYLRRNRLDIAKCTSLENLVLVFLPAADIALFVAEGRVDMGITGQDIVAETECEASKVEETLRLGFGMCRLCVQAPLGHIKDKSELRGKRIITSFPNLTHKHFEKLFPDKETSIHHVSGSVEVACPLGLADAVVDLVESGETMRMAGLEIVDEVMQTQAVLIHNPNTQHIKLIKTLKRRIEGALLAERFVLMEYNVSKNNLDKARSITPGQKAPTISSLEGNPDWVALKVMVAASDANLKMDQLHEIGATDIFVTTISNCRVNVEEDETNTSPK